MVLLNWNENANNILLINSKKHYNLIIAIVFDR